MSKELINQIRSELRFLTGKDINYLIHEADIGSCHDYFEPIFQRRKKLRKMLKNQLDATKHIKDDESHKRGL